MKKSLPGCVWAHEKVLVGLRAGKVVGLSSAFVGHLRAAGVDGVVSLLGRDQFRDAGADMLFGSLGGLSASGSAPARPRVNFTHVFWPEGDTVPTARQVRQTLDEIDEAHAVGLTVFLHGAGVPSRAVIAAACWLARNGCDLNTNRAPAARASLNDAQRTFVRDWPAGRHAEPVLGVTELLDETEPYPTATVEYWLRTLPTVRVYPVGRAGRCLTVPVVAGRRVSNGTVNLELCDLHAGTWIGERTLRLLDGTVVVFTPASRKPTR